MAEWNSLEVAKLIVRAAMPIVLAVVGFAIKSALMLRENIEWRSRLQVEWRVRIFEDMATNLNKLYCAFNYVGDWRSMDPPEILNLKRKLDQSFHIYDFLWSEQFIEAYERLINACFETNRGLDVSAALRTNVRRYKEAWGYRWMASWEDMFVEEGQRLKRNDFNELYTSLLVQLRQDIGLSGGTD